MKKTIPGVKTVPGMSKKNSKQPQINEQITNKIISNDTKCKRKSSTIAQNKK